MSRSVPRPRRRRVLAVLTAVALVMTVFPASAGWAGPPKDRDKGKDACEWRNNNTYEKLIDCVTVEGVREHQAAFQEIADENGGNRAAGLPGYEASADYVAKTMEKAGWEVELHEFDYTFYPPATLRQTAPVTAEYETGAFTGSDSATVEGQVIPVDLALTPPRDSTSGCEPEDFEGIDFGGPADIALLQRGTCTFAAKALNAEAAGAEAVIIFNQGNDPTREGLIIGTLVSDPAEELPIVDIPVVGASFADGVTLAEAGSTAYVEVPPGEERPQVNVIAELEGKNDDNVVMAGAHLDSVQAGPGIQDNGSGSGVLLEIAEQLANFKPTNTLRFAWWGAEEDGLLGSHAYVSDLEPEELEEIALYLNFDMVGSPNYIFMVYDADQSGFEAPVPIPEGSEAIEDVFESYYTWAGEPYDDAEFSGRSDYEAFILNGIPSGGLFTGAEEPKTEEQAAIWGGTVGDQLDPCYHLACDTYDNISLHALDVNADAVAVAVLTYAYSTETVNGVPGKDVPGKLELPEPAGPEGTTGTGGGAHPHPHAA